LGQLVSALSPLTKVQDIYVNFNKIAALPQAFYYSWQVVNNEVETLYYQYLTTVTLASGSTAAIAGQAATNLGAVGSGANAQFANEQTANMTTAPGANEVETIIITIKRYTDSGYTNLFDQTSLLTLNLHLYSDALSGVAVQSTDNFASGSLDGWNTANNGQCNYGDCASTAGYYYDASSGYSMAYLANSCVGSSYQNSNINGSFPLNYYCSKQYSPTNTYTDALIEIYIKAPDGAGWMSIQVDYSDLSPSDYYIFYVPNNTNWFQITIHAKVGVGNTVKAGCGAPYGLGTIGPVSGTFSSSARFYIGTARVIVKSSGSF
jgi:hypothetical protein